MPTQESLRSLAKHLSLALVPLREAVTDLTHFQAFLRRLGWDVTSLPPEYARLGAAIDALIEAVEALPDDPDLVATLEALRPLRDLVVSLRGLSTAPQGVDSGAFLSEFASRLLELLLLDYLALEFPSAYQLLAAANVIRLEPQDATSSRRAFLRVRFDYDQFVGLLTDPASIPSRVYGWGTTTFDFERFADHLLELLTALGFQVTLQQVSPELRVGYQPSPEQADRDLQTLLRIDVMEGELAGEQVEIGVAILELPSEGGRPSGFIIQPSLPPQLASSVQITPDLTLSPRPGSDLSSIFGVLVRPDGLSVRYPLQPGADLPPGGFGATLRYAPQSPALLLGRSAGTRLELGAVALTVAVDKHESDISLVIELALEPALTVASSDQDGFLTKLFGGANTHAPVPIGFRWSSSTGLSVSGSPRFTVATYPQLDIGPVRVREIDLSVRPADPGGPSGIVADAAGSFVATLGPITVSVEGLGLRAGVLFTDGNAGPVDASIGFLPPHGAGIGIDAGAISGAGFLSFDSQTGRYSGGFQLGVYGVSVGAFGMVETRLPSGAAGFSFFVLVDATGFPPVQLGLGFTLDGVGGLLGINRSVAVDALAAAVRSHRIDHVLFPADVVRNAAQIISDLETFFPAVEGRYVFGPMAQIGWGTPTVIEGEIGIVLEVPDPVRLVILGEIGANLPDEDAPIIEIHLDVLGTIDFGTKLLTIDGTLHDSRIAVFGVTGDMAFRLAWSDPPSFALSIGGFHPHFQPPPGFPALRRMTFRVGNDDAHLSLQAYLAVTSNTFQVGALAEAYASAGPFSIYGWLGFDALFIFTPFSFRTDLSAGVDLRFEGETIAGIHLSGTLEGPTPWHAYGEACLSVFFFDICVPFDFTTDSSPPSGIQPPDPIDQLRPAISNAANWSTALPPASLRVVTTASSGGSAGSVPLADPVGSATLRERVVPLDRSIDQFGEAPLRIPTRFSVDQVSLAGQPVEWTPISDYFAPAQFTQMSDADKLSSRSFELMHAGVEIAGGAARLGRDFARPLTYRQRVIDSTGDPFTAGTIALPQRDQLAMIQRGAASDAPLRNMGLERFASPIGTPPLIGLSDEEFVVASIEDLSIRNDIASPGTKDGAQRALADYLRSHPRERGQLQVVPSVETRRAA